MGTKRWFMVALALVGLAWSGGLNPAISIPDDNPMSAAKIELGRRLFYDKQLSLDRTVSCASCHRPEYAFSDGGKAVSVGVGQQKGNRNTPTLTNVGYRKGLFWEGLSPRLELQAIGPLTAHDEMAMEAEELKRRLEANPYYRQAFRQVFGEAPSMKWMAFAISAFERTLVSFDSPYDRFRAGDDNALSEAALRGFDLFFGEKGDCFHCHGGTHFTDDEPRNTGLYAVYPDVGLARATSKEEDVGKFKTPTLRNIALTAPYMHDGSIQTLREAVEHYNSGGKPHPNADALMRPLGLSRQDIDDLVAFLNSLTDVSFTNNPKLGPP